MSAHPEVRNKLLKKLGITSQALNARVGALARRLAIPSDEALYLLAHQNRINLSKALDPATLANVREHVASLHKDTVLDRAAMPPRAPKEQRPQPARRITVEIGALSVDEVPCMGEAMALQARQLARDVYPKLFLIENSARELISRIMTAARGVGWWSTIEPDLQEKSKRYAASELRQAWHPTRGKEPIQFVDLPDLVRIVEDNWDHFKDIFPKKTWFGHFIDDLNVSRRVVAHMSPLKAQGIKYVDASFEKWTSLLKAATAKLPSL